MIVSSSKYRIYLILLLLFLLLSGCIFSTTEPEKKENKPQIISVNISEGQIFYTRDITVTWKGNDLAEQYQYTLDGKSYEWTDSTSVLLTELDEAEHIFSIQARKDTLFSSLTTINFSIDAIQGPGIIFSPRKIIGISFVSVILEDVSELMAAHIEIVCSDDSALLTDFTPAGSIGQNGEIVVFTDDSDPRRMIIDAGFAGITQGVSGRVDLGYLLVRPLKLTGMVSIDSLNTELRDINNSVIDIYGLDMLRIER